MAHFAELDENKIVKRVITFSNEEVDANGGDLSVGAENFVAARHGGTWKQTSYNHNFRKQYAIPKGVYDEAKDKFISPKPHASWSLDANDDWAAPVTFPNTETCAQGKLNIIDWDEDNQRWIGDFHNPGGFETDGAEWAPRNIYRWDVPTLTWIQILPEVEVT